jgi:hypothetical protein
MGEWQGKMERESKGKFQISNSEIQMNLKTQIPGNQREGGRWEFEVWNLELI